MSSPVQSQFLPDDERDAVPGSLHDLKGALKRLSDACSNMSHSYRFVSAGMYLKRAVTERLVYLYGKKEHEHEVSEIEKIVDKDQRRDLVEELNRLVRMVQEAGTDLPEVLESNMNYARKRRQHERPSKPSPFLPLLGDCLADYELHLPPPWQTNASNSGHHSSAAHSLSRHDDHLLRLHSRQQLIYGDSI